MNELDFETSDQPCWSCKNYVDGCNWARSKGETPVEGWTAIPTTKANMGLTMHSFQIIYCPEFVDDGTKHKRWSGTNGAGSLLLENKDFSGFRFKELLDSYGISQNRFSVLCGVANSTLTRYINGLGIPQEKKMKKMASALHLSYEDFYEATRKVK